MKKILRLFILSLILLFTLTLSSCDLFHISHKFDQEVADEKFLVSEATCTSKAVYYKSCTCGKKGVTTFEYGELLAHSFTNYVSNNDATEESDGTKTAICDNCTATNTVTDIGSKLSHTHVYTEVVNDEYLKTAATCTSKAVYYKSCTCGATSTDTFESGNFAEHKFTNYVSNNDATEESDGTKTAICDNCTATNTVTDIGSKLSHTHVYTEIVNDDYLKTAATCQTKAVYYKSCTCGATSTDTFESGEYGDHVYDHKYRTGNGVIRSTATCTSKATYWYSCECRAISNTSYFEYGSLLDHNFTKQTATDAYLCSAGCTDEKYCYYKCCASCGLTSQGTNGEATFFVNKTTPGQQTEYDVDDYYNGYYSSIVSWTDSEDLISQLHNLISGEGYTAIAFEDNPTNWFSNQEADESLYNHMYVDVLYSTTDYLKTRTNVDWQREHCFCASLMCGVSTGDATDTLGRATDFHNLIAGWTTGNTGRGNKNYGYADTTDANYYVRKDNNNNVMYSYDKLNFEPSDEDKGRVARAVFYMTIMYNEDVYDTANEKTLKALSVKEDYVTYVSSNYTEFAIGNLSDLLEWASLEYQGHVVNLQEYLHNESVYSYLYKGTAQGNRNPLVDYPELIDYLYGDKKDQSGELKYLKPTYVDLGLGTSDPYYYAVDEYPLTYYVGDTFKYSDISLLLIDKTLTSTSVNNFTINEFANGYTFTTAGTYTCTIDTDINDIVFTIEVKENPIFSSDYYHKITGYSKGSDLFDYKTSSNQDIEVSLDNENTNVNGSISWIFNWDAGGISANSASLGLQIGSTASPTNTLTIKTKDSVSFNNSTLINRISFTGGVKSPGSGKTYNETQYLMKVYVGSTLVYTTNLEYIDSTTPFEKSVTLDEPLSGQVKIEITGINKSININYIAIDMA